MEGAVESVEGPVEMEEGAFELPIKVCKVCPQMGGVSGVHWGMPCMEVKVF
jgi:hypothetical protein